MDIMNIVFFLVLAVPSIYGIDDTDDYFVYSVDPAIIRKREAPPNKNKEKETQKFKDFVEDKLVEQSQALELLVKLVQKNYEHIELLIENLSQGLAEPKMPEKVESLRRKSSSLSKAPHNKLNPWCSMALLCKRSGKPVCGFDDRFGYGRFDDTCHMFQVNCYWKYSFSLTLHCLPS